MIGNALISSLPLSGDDDLFAADVDVVLLERTGRRPGDVAAGEVVDAVVASAPDLLDVTAVLHGAAQVSAGGGHGLVFAVGAHHEQAGTRTELKDPGGIRFEVADFAGDDGVSAHVDGLGRDQVAHDGI